MAITITAFVLLLATQLVQNSDVKCAPKLFGNGNIVCVCNGSYCDTIQSLPQLTTGHYWQVTSNEAGLRFHKTQATMANLTGNQNDPVTITLNHTRVKQTIYGFGGAFTDSATINIMNLTESARQKLIQSYFSTDGLEYTFGRVPIGGCDFSTRPYTYDDDHDGDFNLTYFSLAHEDLNYKIPIIKQALNMSSRPVKMFASPWSAPGWMKTNNKLSGSGFLKGNPGTEYYQTWANYFLRFLQEYKKNGIKFWGVTAQNEPMDGFIPKFSFNCMGFTPTAQRTFIETNLGPTLANNGFSNVKIMMLDDQRLLLPLWAKEVLNNNFNATKYVDGIGVHWYLDSISPPQLLDYTNNLFPNKFILATEACEGSFPWQTKVVLGSWDRAETYAFDIIQDLSHWVVGWVDWNIALDMTGGPNWASNYVDSPIIVNRDAGEFYKQPMFYALGHFSKFVPPGCVVIDSEMSAGIFTKLHQVAFDCPDNNSTVVVILNMGKLTTVKIIDPKVGAITVDISERSINTFVW